jgi:hypothetical protein
MMPDVGKVAMEMYWQRSELYSALMFNDAEQFQGWKGKDDDDKHLDPRKQAQQDANAQTNNVHKNAAKDPKTEKERKPNEKPGEAKNIINTEDVVERITPEEKAKRNEKENNEKMIGEIEKGGGRAVHTAAGVEAIGKDGQKVNHSNEKNGQFASSDLAFQKGLENVMSQLKTPGTLDVMNDRVQEVSSSNQKRAA